MQTEDIIKQLKDSPARMIESLVASFIKDGGTEQDRKDIVTLSRENNLEFLIPEQWFDSLEKAERTSEVTIQVTCSTEYADFLKQVLRGLETDKEGISVVLLEGRRPFKRIQAPLKEFSFEEALTDNIEPMTKAEKLPLALTKVVFSPDSQVHVKAIIDAIKGQKKITIGNDDSFDYDFNGYSLEDLNIKESADSFIASYPRDLKIYELFSKIDEFCRRGVHPEIFVDDQLYEGEFDLKETLFYDDPAQILSELGTEIKPDIRLANNEEFIFLQTLVAEDGATVGVMTCGTLLVLCPAEQTIRIAEKIEEATPFFINLAAYDNTSSSCILYLQRKGDDFEKAERGTPAYDEWLRKYQEKRKAETNEDGSEKEDSPMMQSIKELLERLPSQSELIEFQTARAENEAHLEEMFAKASSLFEDFKKLFQPEGEEKSDEASFNKIRKALLNKAASMNLTVSAPTSVAQLVHLQQQLKKAEEQFSTKHNLDLAVEEALKRVALKDTQEEVDDIISAVAGEFEVSPEEIESTILAQIAELELNEE